MKRIFLFGALFFAHSLQPCTTLSFVDDGGQRVFGKTFDWYFNHGVLFVNKRNMSKEALMLDDSLPLKWVSRFGSVTFNQHGRDFPLGGINEAGLVVEIMIGPTEDIPANPNIRNVNEVQIIQYMLDSFASITELRTGLQNLRVARVSTDVHYLVCDKDAECSTVEYLDGSLVMHYGERLPYKAFTNSAYADSANYASDYLGLGGSLAIPTGNGSLARFVRAASAARSYTGGDSERYVHNFLDQVALSGRWRIVYRGPSVSFRVDPYLSRLKTLNLNLDFRCSTPVQTYSMNQAGEGDIAPYLRDYTKETNQELANSNFLLPGELRRKIINYPETHTLCLESPAIQ